MTGRAGPSPRRRLASTLHQRSGLRLSLLLATPVGWLVVAYLGSLVVLFINAFWQRDAFTGLVVREFTLDNFREIIENPLYRTVTLRTVFMAAAVTVTCAVLAFPIAYYMARVASPRVRGLLVVAVLIPLWASYLIKAYSWRLILAEDGVMNWFLEPFGLKGPGYGEVGLWPGYEAMSYPLIVPAEFSACNHGEQVPVLAIDQLPFEHRDSDAKSPKCSDQMQHRAADSKAVPPCS
jgi:putative spermidine/putrescine transport system permease protein